MSSQKKLNLVVLLIFTCLFTGTLFSQEFMENGIMKDTSYTVNSAYKKLVKKYPDIKIAKFSNDKSYLSSKGVVYAAYSERKMVVDIFSNEDNNESKPLVVLVHGGGWRTGDRSLLYPVAEYLAANGFVAAVIEYRLSPEALYPAAIDDINASIDFLRKNAEEYGINKNQVAVLGSSAGAQMAGLVALKYVLDDNGKKRIHAFVNVDGIMDFSSEEARKWEDDPKKKVSSAGKWFGGRYAEKPELWKEASPMYYVTKNSPPMVFINSSYDRFHVGRDEVIEQLNNFDIYSEVHTLEDSPHSFWLFEPWYKPACKYTVEFLNKVF